MSRRRSSARHIQQIRPQQARNSEVGMCWMDWCEGKIIERQLFKLELSSQRGWVVKNLRRLFGPCFVCTHKGGPKKPPKLIVMLRMRIWVHRIIIIPNPTLNTSQYYILSCAASLQISKLCPSPPPLKKLPY